MQLDQHRLCVELQRLAWAHDLKEEVVEDIVASASLAEYQAGQVVIERDSDVTDVYFVISGRLEGALSDRLGKEIHRDEFRRGSVVGLFSVLLPDRSYLHVEATEHTTVIVLGVDDLLRLTAKHREFQLAMFRVAANVVKRVMRVDRDRPRPAAVAVVHHSDTSRPLAVELVGAFGSSGSPHAWPATTSAGSRRIASRTGSCSRAASPSATRRSSSY
jgi:CRP-like cAMP-binding protein